MIKRDKVYYIGFSPINGICNELFFEGSITMYPNKIDYKINCDK